MFRTEPIDLSICPKRNPSLSSVASVWSVVAPALSEEGSCVQIDGKYVLSLGAHFTHAFALLSKTHPIDYLTAIEVCNALSFLFDTPIGVGTSFRERDARTHLRGMKQILRLKGIQENDVPAVQRFLAERVEWLAETADDFQRLLPVAPSNNGKFLAIDLPKNQSITNALVAYRQALLSPDPVGEILNYWRVLEATTSTPNDRTRLLDHVFEARLSAVIVRHRYSLRERKEFNLVSRYKAAAKRHAERLRSSHGTNADVMTFLYKQRRCPAAHARSDVLKPDAVTSLHNLYADALLMKCLARFAIESRY